MSATATGTGVRWVERIKAAPPELQLPYDGRRAKTLLAGEAPRTGVAVVETNALGDVLGIVLRAGFEPREAVFAAFVAVLHRYGGDRTILVVEERPAVAEAALVDVGIESEATFRSLVHTIAKARDRARSGLTLPFTDAPASFASLPLGLAPAHAGVRWETWAADTVPLPRAFELLDVALESRVEDGASLALRYRSDRFSLETAHRMLDHLVVLLAAAAAQPDVPIANLPLLSDPERELQGLWNHTSAAYSAETDLVALVRAATTAHADAAAVEFDGDMLSFRELERRTEALSERLRRAGVGPGTLVALLVERSLDMYVGVFGIQRAGGAYVPIDPAYPRDRIDFMLEDSGVPVVVTQRRLRDAFSRNGAVTIVLDEPEGPGDANAPPLGTSILHANPGQIAYVIYTSGSTGRPKGVAIRHSSVVNLLFGMQAAFKLGLGDTLLAVAPLAFDMSVPDIYLATVSGARVVIASREAATNPKALGALLRSSRATHVQATPSTWRMLIDAGWEGDPALTIVTGGEALPAGLGDRLLDRAKAVWNFYGPTEATVWATMHRLSERGETPTIGRPMANVTTHVLDSSGQPVPVGVIGELYIGGAGLAAGYLNRSELTADRFALHALGGSEAVRLYRTGDLARYRPDGSLDFIGRADFQVKLRGYRIELGEVEAVFTAQAAVRAAVAVVREDVPGEQRLVAYVEVEPGEILTPNALRRAAAFTLPAYMVPDNVVFLEALPISANGKVDRARLPAPLAADVAPREETAPLVGARTALEAQLIAIWEEVLDVRPIGVTDDFFDLGASSISAARLFGRVENELGAALPLSPLFSAPTIEKLAALLDEGPRESRFSSLVPIQPLGSKTPIYCVHGGAGTILHFAYLAKQLGTEQPFYGLQMRGLYGDAPPLLFVRSMAAHYLREIRQLQPNGPYVIAGYCFGAIVAFEMARQLERSGERVAKLIVINGPSPAYLWKHRRRRGFRWTLWNLPLILATRAYALLGRPLPEAWRERANYLVHYVAESWYRPKIFSGSALVVSAAGSYLDRSLGWRPFITGGLATVEVPGHHRDARQAMHEPYVAVVAAAIRSSLEAPEAAQR